MGSQGMAGTDTPPEPLPWPGLCRTIECDTFGRSDHMATIEKRVLVTPSAKAGPLLSAMSEISGQPKARLIRELLDEAVPVMETMLEAHRMLATQPEAARAAMARMFDQAMSDGSQAMLDLDKAIAAKPGPKRTPKPGKPRKGAAKT